MHRNRFRPWLRFITDLGDGTDGSDGTGSATQQPDTDKTGDAGDTDDARKSDGDAELGAGGVKALKVERAAHKAATEQVRELTRQLEQAKATAPDTQQLATELAEIKHKLAERDAQLARTTVATTKGLDPTLLEGIPTDQLEARADAILAWAKTQAGPHKPTPDPGQGKGDGAGGGLEAGAAAWAKRHPAKKN